MGVADGSEKTGVSFAHWVRDTIALMRTQGSDRIALFESSVPEPADLLAQTIRETFRDGMPETYKSVFMRNHPDVAAQLSRRYDVPEANILCTTGATSTVSLLYATLVRPGDRILVEAPGFDIFTNLAIPAGLSVDFYRRAAPDFAIHVEGVLAALKPETRMVVLTNLHNPSGAKTSEDVLAQLAEALDARGVVLVLDEVYRDYFDGIGAGLDTSRYQNVVRISSFTKIFGLNALRCGWLFAGPKLMAPVRDHSERTDFSVSRIAHGLAAEVLARSDLYDGWRRDHMNEARPIVEATLKEMRADGLIDMDMSLNGCTCFPRIVGIEDTAALSHWLSERHGVIVVPGECFAAPGHVRIGYALKPERLSQALARLSDGLRAYQQKSAHRNIA